MDGPKQPPLTFAHLDAMIEALPEGPVAALNPPQWARQWAMIGVLGVLLGLSPSLLIQWLEPSQWMLVPAFLGVLMTLAGFAPLALHGVQSIAREVRHHRRGMIEQFDHDAEQFRQLAERLADYPPEAVQVRARMARMGHARLKARIGTLAGSFERLGILPVMLSLAILLRNLPDLLDMPFWSSMLAMMAAAFWLIAFAAGEFMRRLDLYVYLLDEAQHCQADRERRRSACAGHVEAMP